MTERSGMYLQILLDAIAQGDWGQAEAAGKAIFALADTGSDFANEVDHSADIPPHAHGGTDASECTTCRPERGAQC